MPPQVFGLAILGAAIMTIIQIIYPPFDNIPWWLELIICYLYYRLVMIPVIDSHIKPGGTKK